jgi:hypothetical protein
VSDEEEERHNPPLEWEDYVAIVIAMFETVLVPILVILAIFAVLVLILLL